MLYYRQLKEITTGGKNMSTSLSLINHETTDYKYVFALRIVLFDMQCIRMGRAEEINFNPYLINVYFNDAFRLMH